MLAGQMLWRKPPANLCTLLSMNICWCSIKELRLIMRFFRALELKWWRLCDSAIFVLGLGPSFGLWRSISFSSRVSGSESPPSIWKVHAALVLVQCAVGGGYVLIKVALTTGVNPIVFAVYKDILALCTLVPVAYFAEKGKRPLLDLTTLGLLALLGVFGIFSSQVLLLFGLKLATAALSSIISITIPVCVFFISAVFRLEDINWRQFDGKAKVGGLISAVVGTVVIALYKGPAILGHLSVGVRSGSTLELLLDGNSISPFTAWDLRIETWQIGVILLFLSGLCLSIYITLQIPTLKRFPAPVSITAFAYFFGCLALAIVGFKTVENRSEWVIHQPSAIFAALYGGVVLSGANFALQAWALHIAGPVLVASYTPLHAIITSLLALIFTGESIYLGSVLGTLPIINGLYFITLGKIHDRKLAGRQPEGVQLPDSLPITKAVSNLEEPLLR